MTDADLYGSGFFEGSRDLTAFSAKKIVDILTARVGRASVVDFGCGTGVWLLGFAEAGVRTLRGVDGHHIDAGWLEIPAECFVAQDC